MNLTPSRLCPREHCRGSLYVDDDGGLVCRLCGRTTTPIKVLPLIVTRRRRHRAQKIPDAAHSHIGAVEPQEGQQRREYLYHPS